MNCPGIESGALLRAAARWLAALLGATAWFVPLTFALAGESRLVAHVALESGAIHKYELAEGWLRLETAVGSIRLDLAEVDYVEKERLPPNDRLLVSRERMSLSDGYGKHRIRYEVGTVRGDRHKGDLSRIEALQRGILGNTSLELGKLGFKRVDILGGNVAFRPLGHAAMRLKDGSVLLLDRGESFLNVENRAGKWKVPLGSVQAVDLGLMGTNGRWGGEITFASARTMLFTFPKSKRTIRLRDTYGNKLGVPVKDIAVIKGRIGIPAGFVEGPMEDGRDSYSGEVTSDEGASGAAEFPALVWEIESSAGRIALPIGVVRAITRDRLERGHCVETVYGERIIGKVSPEYVDVAVLPSQDGRRLKLSRSEKIVFKGSEMIVPDGWLVWRLRTGDIFCALPSESQIAFVHADGGGIGRLDVPELESITVDEKGRCVAESRGSSVQSIVPRGRTVEIVLLSNGMTCRVPWGEIVRVDKNTSALRSLPPIGGSKNDEAGRKPERRGLLEGLSKHVKRKPQSRSAVAEGEMVLVEGGSFSMGRTRGEGMEDELPVHEVTVTSFYMDIHEVCKRQFEEFVTDGKYKTDAERSRGTSTWRHPGFMQNADDPVVCVSWRDAASYCNWRSRRDGLNECYRFKRNGEVLCDRKKTGYRLPTEAEWEYAARSRGMDVVYPWETGQRPDDGGQTTETKATSREQPSREVRPEKMANFRPRSGEKEDNWTWTNPVKEYAPNSIGLYGMGGNVWEWCEDWYFEKAYEAIHRRKSQDPCVILTDMAGLSKRVMRGGSFENELDFLRCSSRGSGPPAASADRLGFRCVRTLVPRKTVRSALESR